MIEKLTLRPSCPKWPILKDVSLGHWTNTIVEFLGETKDGPPSHMHVYEWEKARKGFAEGKFTIPNTIVSVSYGYEGDIFTKHPS